jgi:flagellar biosynthesis/type III secretory pathway protein FliH
MVIAMEPRIARWARAILDNLCADVYFHFVVISSADVPHIIDPAKAKETPELAVLSAIAYPTLEVAQAALAGIEGLPDDRAHLYYDVILNGLSEATRNQLESTVQQYPYRSDFARKNYALGEASGLEKGHEKGLEKGLEEGREEGREAGRLALQTAAIELARTRLERLSADQEAAIRSFVDESALAALIIALGTTSTPEQARAVLARPAR